MAKTRPARLRTAIPGPRSRALAARAARAEGAATAPPADAPPIFWARARGANVWDADGNRFVDLVAGFGVANVGHAHPRVVRAIARQSRTLLHAMSEWQPAALKVELLEKLCALFPVAEDVADARADTNASRTSSAPAARAVLACSGSDAVEVALKTALLATGRAGVIAFEGAYHGLSLGALDLTWREDFRAPFRARLAARTGFARYGDASDLDRAADAAGAEVGAVIVEPVLGRGGMRPAPRGFLRALRARCDAEGWLLIADEIYSGCGRSGRWFACEHEGVTPDLLCVGKGLASGMPLAAVVGRAEVMDAWPAPAPDAEALHTQTFLGHPASCAAALATLDVLEAEGCVTRSAALGARAQDALRAGAQQTPRIRDVRGLGLMLGVECDSAETAAAACERALARGVIVSRAGADGRVLALTPPLCIEEKVLDAALAEVLACIR